MKRLLLLAIPALLTSCQYTISGTAGKDLEGKQAYLCDGEGQNIDSCVIENGTFKFKGKVDGQSLYAINIEKTRLGVILTNGTTVDVNLNENPATVTDNGGYNDTYAAIMNKVSEASAALREKARKLMADGLTYPQVNDSIKEDIEALYDIYRKALDENKDNIVGARILGIVANQFYNSIEEMDSIMKVVKYASEIKAVNLHLENLQTLENTKEGKMFIDFTGKNIDGTVAKLSDYVGKGQYVLVDFWASWCGPCKGEIPNLIELQNQYAGEKFTVLGINVWDTEEKFKTALEEEGIEYPQIFVPRDNKDNATQLYGIQGIPQIMLFAPDGTIVKRNLRGQEMKDFVANQLK